MSVLRCSVMALCCLDLAGIVFCINIDLSSIGASLLDIITVKDPITDEEYIVGLRYNGKKMLGGIDGLSFGR